MDEEDKAQQLKKSNNNDSKKEIIQNEDLSTSKEIVMEDKDGVIQNQEDKGKSKESEAEEEKIIVCLMINYYNCRC